MRDIERCRQIVELSTDATIEIDGAGMVCFVNGAAVRLLELAHADDAMDKPWHTLVPPAVGERLDEAVRAAFVGSPTQFTAMVDTDDDARCWYVTAHPLPEPDGRVDFALLQVRDVTERMRVEQALDLLNRSLENRLYRALSAQQVADARTQRLHGQLDDARQRASEQHTEQQAIRKRLNIAEAAQAMAEQASQQAQKGEAIGQLVAGIAHDFNNMLQTAIISLSSVTESSERLAPDQRRLLGFTTDALRHGAVLSKRLLAFARVHRFEARPIDLVKAVAGMADLVQHSLGVAMRLDVEAGDAALPTFADLHSVEQAFMNLCINARDACDGRGTITVRFGQRAVPREDADPIRAAGDYVTISVTDTGSGMDRQTRERLFEPYFTTKPEGKGTGLGLAQVYGLMRQAGGFVDVHSELGVGTTMQLAFPRRVASALVSLA